MQINELTMAQCEYVCVCIQVDIKHFLLSNFTAAESSFFSPFEVKMGLSWNELLKTSDTKNHIKFQKLS